MPVDVNDVETPVVGVETVASFVLYDPVTDAPVEGGTPALIKCTRKINFDPPEHGMKFVSCGLDGTAYRIPIISKPGTMNFTSLDFANKDIMRGLHDKRLVVTLETSRGDLLLRTDTITDWLCKISVDHPEDAESTVSATGEYKTFTGDSEDSSA